MTVNSRGGIVPTVAVKRKIAGNTRNPTMRESQIYSHGFAKCLVESWYAHACSELPQAHKDFAQQVADCDTGGDHATDASCESNIDDMFCVPSVENDNAPAHGSEWMRVTDDIVADAAKSTLSESSVWMRVDG